LARFCSKLGGQFESNGHKPNRIRINAHIWLFLVSSQAGLRISNLNVAVPTLREVVGAKRKPRVRRGLCSRISSTLIDHDFFVALGGVNLVNDPFRISRIRIRGKHLVFAGNRDVGDKPSCTSSWPCRFEHGFSGRQPGSLALAGTLHPIAFNNLEPVRVLTIGSGFNNDLGLSRGSDQRQRDKKRTEKAFC
jgi:hypothetical protein